MSEPLANSLIGEEPPLPVAQAPVGLLAGYGRFPLYFAERAKSMGLPVVCVGIRNEASPDLASLVDRFYWSGVTQLGRIIRCFKREGVRQIVMAGKVHKRTMYSPWLLFLLLLDLRALRFWYTFPRRNNQDDTLTLAIMAEFERDGMTFESALTLCPELLVKAGVLTRRKPTPQEEADIRFGWQLARDIGRVDVGQSVCVKKRAVLAVEAIEGTDQAILRAGTLCYRGNFVVVKVAKPNQDMRFDVPTVGTNTIESMHKAGGRVLAIEAGKTIVLDQAETVALAERYGITIVARDEHGCE